LEAVAKKSDREEVDGERDEMTEEREAHEGDGYS
jgi:hypothetical protein